jgi:hypothetical protein
LKGYKLCDPASRRILYSRDVVSIEVGGKSEPKEVFQIENNPNTMRFEMRNKEDYSDESTESKEEVEQKT